MNSQIIENTEFNSVLTELQNNLTNFDENFTEIVAYCSTFLASSKEMKQKALQVAGASLDAVLFFNEIKKDFKRIGSLGEKVGAAVAVGSLLYAAYQHIKERKEMLKQIDNIKELSLQNFEGIQVNFNKLEFILRNMTDVIENKIIRIIDYLAKSEPTQERAESLLKVFHQFVKNYLEYSYRLRFFQSYKELLKNYLEREIFTKGLDKIRAEVIKNNYINDWRQLQNRFYQGENSLGSLYGKILISESQQNREGRGINVILTLIIIILFLFLSFTYNFWFILGIPVWFALRKILFRKNKKKFDEYYRYFQNFNIDSNVIKQIHSDLLSTIDRHLKNIESCYIDGDFSREKVFEVYYFLMAENKKHSSKLISLILDYLRVILDLGTKKVKKEACLEFDVYIISTILNWYNNDKKNINTLEAMFKDNEFVKLWMSEKIGKRSFVTKIAKFFS